MPNQSYAFFLSAIAFLIVGIGIGIFMIFARDHGLAPAHAHINLLGWVSSAIMGLFYAHNRASVPGRLIWTQYAVYTVGVACLSGGLAALLLGKRALMPLVHVGLLGTVLGVLLFAAAIVVAVRRRGAHPIHGEAAHASATFRMAGRS